MSGPQGRVAPREQDRDWRGRGACHDDPDLFTPPGYTATYTVQIEAAAALCRECPVIGQCREWIAAFEQGLGEASRDGVWAAMTPAERWEADDAAHEPPAPRRPSGRAFDPATTAAVAGLRDKGMTGVAIARELGITESRAYRVIRHLGALRAGRDMAGAQSTGSG